jgi:hypothetical protein
MVIAYRGLRAEGRRGWNMVGWEADDEDRPQQLACADGAADAVPFWGA